MRPTFLLLLLLATASLPTFAKPPKEQKTKTLTDEEAFKALDKDGDNLISKDEFSAGAPPSEEGRKSKRTKASSNAGEDFEKLDADKDGKLTLEEFSKREPVAGKPDRKKRKATE